MKSKKIGALGVDVYENEEPLFFEDLSEKIIEDDLFSRLKNFPNVVITGHQAFFTQEALENISACTIGNLASFFDKGECPNEVPFKKWKSIDYDNYIKNISELNIYKRIYTYYNFIFVIIYYNY